MNQLQDLGSNVSTISLGARLGARRKSFIKLGELPKSFMFNRIKQRKRHNQIFMLRNEDGTWLDDQYAIAQLIVHHFQNLYILSRPDMVDPQKHADNIDLVLRGLHLPRILNVEVNSLLAPFSYQEIQCAMFYIANDKSPGLDGFRSEFFQSLLAYFGISCYSSC